MRYKKEVFVADRSPILFSILCKTEFRVQCSTFGLARKLIIMNLSPSIFVKKKK